MEANVAYLKAEPSLKNSVLNYRKSLTYNNNKVSHEGCKKDLSRDGLDFTKKKNCTN